MAAATSSWVDRGLQPVRCTVGPALPQHQAQVGGLGLQVDGHRHPQAGEGLLLLEAGLNAAQAGMSPAPS